MSIVSYVLAFLILLAATASTLVLYSFHHLYGIIQFAVFLALIIGYFIFWYSKRRYYNSVIRSAEKYFESHGGAESYPMPVAPLPCDHDGEQPHHIRQDQRIHRRCAL